MIVESGNHSPAVADVKTEVDHAPATLADEALLGKKEARPGLSYLKSLDKIESLYAAGEYGEALIHLTPLLKHYSKKARLYAMQGTLLQELHEPSLALEAYRKAQGLEPTNREYERAADAVEKGLDTL